jgi:alpha-1,3-glucosyltransferase
VGYASERTILFQRTTVVVTDLVLVGAVLHALPRQRVKQRDVSFALVVAHAGLLLVDHIHFQYNGMLLGAQPATPSGCSSDYPT